MVDNFQSFRTGRSSPGVRHFEITPADGADINPRPRAIRVGGAGDVALRDDLGVDIIYTLAAGEVLPFSPVRVLATGTTATDIVGWV